MKLKPIVLANTFAILAFFAFAICMIWAMIDKSSFIAFWESWAHGFNLELIATDRLGSFNAKSVYGLVSFTLSSWITGYALAWLYNRMAKEN